jgi:hypothetical protein
MRIAAFIMLVGVALLLATARSAPPAGAFASDSHHELITREALSFLRATVLDKVVRGDLSQDEGFLDPKFPSQHFDSCRFTRTTDYIRSKSDETLTTLRPVQRPQPLSAAYELGRYLHPAQDFYSHSNWVELGRADLLDFGLGAWRRLGDWTPLRDDLVVGQGEHMPAGWSRRSDKHVRVPVVATPAGIRRVVITGMAAYSPDACHDELDLSHDALNKDHVRLPGFAPARELAVRQTRHEWCRLLHRLNDRYGARGPGAALALLVRQDRSPHPAGTPCAGDRGVFAWRVRVASIRVRDTRDGDEAGEVNFVSALFRTDFRGSSRSQTGPVGVRPGQLVPARLLPGPLTICAAAGDASAAATVQAWDDDDGRDGTLDIADGQNTDDVLEGVTLPLQSVGAHTVSSRDLTVRFVVEHPTLPDPCQTAIG